MQSFKPIDNTEDLIMLSFFFNYVVLNWFSAAATVYSNTYNNAMIGARSTLVKSVFGADHSFQTWGSTQAILFEESATHQAPY